MSLSLLLSDVIAEPEITDNTVLFVLIGVGVVSVATAVAVIIIRKKKNKK